MEIGLSTKRKLGFVKGTIPTLLVVPQNDLNAAVNAVNIEMWETCNNLVISWIMSSVYDSIAKSVMFIGSASEIWSQLETRFSLSNGSRKYKLCKDTFGISQQGSCVIRMWVMISAQFLVTNGIHQKGVGKKLGIQFGIISIRLKENKISPSQGQGMLIKAEVMGTILVKGGLQQVQVVVLAVLLLLLSSLRT
ncbi:hypothetical protein CTI12_AA325740 [Artemisia annua]|uniref:Retrotransposon Copia-like N-terminal domain-containing protein n=1 Tax=Artemisia annua TaxID=35608 RepID=A0A2U1MZF4_ARTAN|nr:hypothetical protein CTI12_AA325740 [Artemisia annua]